MALIFSRTRSFSSNEMPGCTRALARFSDSPHSSQKNSSKISRHCAGVRKAFSSRRSAPGGGKMELADGGPAVRQLELLADGRRQMILERLEGFENAVRAAAGRLAW